MSPRSTPACNCDLLVQYPSARSPQVHVSFSRKNNLFPPWPLHHLCLHISNCCVFERCQVTSNYVPSSIPCRQMAHNAVCIELAYHLDCKGGGVPVFFGPVALSCVCFYRPAMVLVIVAVTVVAVFVNVVAVVVLGLGRHPHKPLPSCHPPNGENTKAWA